MTGRIALSFVPVLAVLAGLAACDAPEGTPADLPLLALVEQVRLGELDGPEAFSAIRSRQLAILSDGRIAVGQQQTSDIKLVDPQRRSSVVTIGGRGQGPGEFNLLLSIGAMADTLYAVGANPPSVSFFSIRGEHMRTVAWAPADGMERPTPPYVLLADGTGIVNPATAADRLHADPRQALVRVDRSGAVIDTLAFTSTGRIRLDVGGGRVAILDNPFADGQLAVINESASRVVIVERESAARADGAVYTVIQRDLQGDTIYRKAYSYSPVPVDASAAADTIARMAGVLMDRGQVASRGEAERIVRESLTVPAFHAPVEAVVASTDGGLWLKLRDRNAPTNAWQIHDGSGTPIANVVVASGLEIRLVAGDAVWGVEHDALGVPYVVRYGVR